MGTIQIAIERCRVGPITRRYMNGRYREVDGDGKYAVLGLDRSHNGDYQVSYASDPLLVVTVSSTNPETADIDTLETFLRENDLWLQSMNPIEIPAKNADGAYVWKPGFKTTPRDSRQFSLLKSRAEDLAENDHDYYAGENTAAVHVEWP